MYALHLLQHNIIHYNLTVLQHLLCNRDMRRFHSIYCHSVYFIFSVESYSALLWFQTMISTIFFFNPFDIPGLWESSTLRVYEETRITGILRVGTFRRLASRFGTSTSKNIIRPLSMAGSFTCGGGRAWKYLALSYPNRLTATGFFQVL